jgi:hypothetical protein
VAHRTPEVNSIAVYKEIASDFSHPREMLKEAISNSIDADAEHIDIEVNFNVNSRTLDIIIKDDGHGMDHQTIGYLFSLGFSKKREGSPSIGSKGHGAKTFLRSNKIDVKTSTGESSIRAVMDNPLEFLTSDSKEFPTYEVLKLKEKILMGTEIRVTGVDFDDITDFEKDKLHLWLRWWTGAGRLNHIWKPNEKPVHITLKVKGIPKPSKADPGWKWVTTGKGEKWENKFYWKHAPNHIVSEGSSKGRYLYFPPMFVTDPKGIKLKFAIARLEEWEVDEMMYGNLASWEKGAAKADWTGFYLAKDGIIIEKLEQRDLGINHGDLAKWVGFVDCTDFSLTANRHDLRRTKEYLTAKAMIRGMVNKLQNTKKHPHEILQSQGYEVTYVEDFVSLSKPVTKSERKAEATQLSEFMDVWEKPSGIKKPVSKPKISRKRRKSFLSKEMKEKGPSSIDEAKVMEKANQIKTKNIGEIEDLKASIDEVIRTDGGHSLNVPVDGTDCALLLAFISAVEDIGGWTLLKLKVSGKKSENSIGLIVGKNNEMKTVTFIKNLENLVKGKFSSVETEYIVCWEIGNFKFDTAILANHIDDKKRRLNVVKDTLIEKGTRSDKKLNETKLIILKDLIKKLNWPITEIESKY